MNSRLVGFYQANGFLFTPANAGAVQNKTTKDLEAAGGGRVNVMKRLVSMRRDEASLSGEITSKFDQGSTTGREEGGDMKMATWKLSKRCKQWAEERKQMDRCRVFCPMQNCIATVNLSKIAGHLHRVHSSQKWWLPLRCPDCEESVESTSLQSYSKPQDLQYGLQRPQYQTSQDTSFGSSAQ